MTEAMKVALFQRAVKLDPTVRPKPMTNDEVLDWVNSNEDSFFQMMRAELSQARFLTNIIDTIKSIVLKLELSDGSCVLLGLESPYGASHSRHG